MRKWGWPGSPGWAGQGLGGRGGQEMAGAYGICSIIKVHCTDTALHGTALHSTPTTTTMSLIDPMVHLSDALVRITTREMQIVYIVVYIHEYTRRPGHALDN